MEVNGEETTMKDDDPSAGGEGSSVVKLRTQDGNDDMKEQTVSGSVVMQTGSLVDVDRAVDNGGVVAQHIRALRSQKLALVAPTDQEDNGVDTDDPATRSDTVAPWSVAGRKRKFTKPKTPPKKASSDGELAAPGPSPLRKAQRKAGFDCSCGKDIQGAVWICCMHYSNWFHIDCVYLTGLCKEHVKLLRNWQCISCMTGNLSAPVDEKVPNSSEIRQIVRQELAIVKEELVSVTKSVQSCVKNDVRSYSDVIKSGQKEVLEAATAPALVKDVCQSLNVENMERKKKKNNVLVTNVPEADATVTGEQKREHDINYLCSDKLNLVREDISTCFRAGRVKKDEDGKLLPRPVVVVFHREETAVFWHNDGKGYKAGPHWINEDLCQSDRAAKFFVRQQRRNRLQQRQEQINQQKNLEIK